MVIGFHFHTNKHYGQLHYRYQHQSISASVAVSNTSAVAVAVAGSLIDEKTQKIKSTCNPAIDAPHSLGSSSSCVVDKHAHALHCPCPCICYRSFSDTIQSPTSYPISSAAFFLLNKTKTSNGCVVAAAGVVAAAANHPVSNFTSPPSRHLVVRDGCSCSP